MTAAAGPGRWSSRPQGGHRQPHQSLSAPGPTRPQPLRGPRRRRAGPAQLLPRWPPLKIHVIPTPRLRIPPTLPPSPP
jgi:hypothetical protein